jgi:acetyl-CoA acetyltransferase
MADAFFCDYIRTPIVRICAGGSAGIADDDPRVNPNAVSIALGHPLDMTGARIAGSAAMDLAAGQGRYALATMCVGVGQGAALLLERV